MITRARVVVMAFCLSVHAGAVEQILPTHQWRPDMEAYDNRVRLSGSGVLGLFVGAPESAVDVTRIRVFPPADAAGSLCVAITSRDGKYHGEFPYVLPEHPAPEYVLQMPSQFQGELARYKSHELAMVAELRDCPTKASSGTRLLLASWGPRRSGDPLIVLINAQGNDVTLYVPGAPPKDCEPLRAPVRTAFNTQCQIAITSGMKLAGSVLEFSHFEERRSVPVPIVVP